VVEGAQVGWLEWALALVERRDPFLNAKQPADWTCVGPCAHESASKVRSCRLPSFRL